MILDELEHNSVLILGFGVEGQGTYSFIRERFPNKHLSIADRRNLHDIAIPDATATAIAHDANLRFYDNPDYLSCLPLFQLVIKSPGIPPSLPELVAYRAEGGTVTSHLELFFSLVGTRNVIGVTGTKGKSTTATLIHHIFRGAGIQAILAGNIGAPPLASLHPAESDGCRWVVECSSYQLAEMHCSPHIAVLLGVVPDHLGLHDPSLSHAHHRDFASYIAAKEMITRHQGPDDVLIFNADNEIAAQVAQRSHARLFPVSQRRKLDSGCFQSDGKLFYSDRGVSEEIVAAKDIPLLGQFNQINVMAAAAAARMAGASGQGMSRSISTFHGLPHRLEFVGEASGILFYDDSISTVPQATINALEALGPGVTTVILGGHDRGSDFSTLAAALTQRHVRHLILFSPSGLRLWQSVEQECGSAAKCPMPHFVTSMQMAVDQAMRCTAPGEICLLSPASASYGMFKNFEERGTAFRKAIPFGRTSNGTTP
ncbi:MAG TPA: UDP-N-acetylmuramoyl-L-alanine--D-glutamate ligase [Terracidiphilus sp.]|jgi:UDP-N-acetylmuramoylalanine--D-glutamate ligase|nr:UDP-N-acetylmuramoyl-L-alanine--D-glutamate ligase [Terracidiphilus sp.]